MPTARPVLSIKRASKQRDPVSSRESPPAKVSNIISSELEVLLSTAFINARERRHEFVTVEHLLYELADADLSSISLRACGVDIESLKSKLSIYIDENTPIVDTKGDVDTQPTLGFQRVVQRAIMHVQSTTPFGKEKVGSNDILLAIFGESQSHAVYCLLTQGVTRADVVNYVLHGLKKARSSAKEKNEAKETVTSERASREFRSFVADATQTLSTPNLGDGKRPKLFISYSHVDTACLDRLLVHLKPLERANTVVCWSDRRLRTGDKWKIELEKNLSDSVIAILLVSADFLASDFIVNNELPPLLIKADSRGLRILPVILKPCGFRRDPILSTFQSANDPAAPL
jgi:TIR domain/Clp amino terminal domain, pathogenicity island component